MNGQIEKSVRRRIWKDKLFKSLIIVLSLSSIVPMFLILFMITKNGIAVVDWQFLSHLPKPVGEIGGGIANALAGSLWLVVLAFIFSVPLGVFAGIFLAEYQGGKWAYLTRLSVETLQGIPSIVIGIIAYVWVVMAMGS
ncbi:MAG: phosphate ABC transporter permease PtsA, partial [Deltaproteobacteria bacterium]|nr:phosphate ABC transporter permease PtsA [Deltaproteobacteria bacterium]